VDQRIRIHFNRRIAFGAAALFGFLIVIGTEREIQAHSVLGSLFVIGFFGLFFVISSLRLLQRRPVLVIDDHTFTVGRSHQVIPWRPLRIIPWDTIFEAHLLERKGVLVVFHELVLTIRGDNDLQGEESLAELRTSKVAVQTVEVSLDQLSMSWSDIVGLAQERLGKNIPTRHQAGAFRKPVA
jgi:hypothetical protein